MLLSQDIKLILCVTRQPIMQPLVDLSHRYKGYLVCKDDLQEMRKRETFKLLGGKSFKLVFCNLEPPQDVYDFGNANIMKL